MKTFATGLAVVMVASVASAQTPARTTESDAVKARQKISMMEGVLERAVSNGADNVLRQMREIVPVADSPLMLLGQPHVRGFRLDGYGVFFDVEVPAMRLSMAWALRYVVDQNGVTAGAAVADLRSFVTQQARDPRDREKLERALQRIEAQVGPSVPRTAAAANAAAATRVADQGPANGTALIGPSQVDPVIIEDPNEAFTREVKDALVEAMIENSGPIAIGTEEYLVVAARDNARTDRLAVPSDAASDLHTIMIRIKGSDLAAFREGRMGIEETKKRVQVREY
jgi:hypothetical protein